MTTALNPRWVAGITGGKGAAVITGAPFATSVGGSGTGSYLQDQFSNPWLMRGDFSWALVTNAGQGGSGGGTWQADMTNYLAARAGQGFNMVYCTLLNCTALGGPANSGATFDGVVPFTGGIGVLTSAYWARVDYLVTTAAAYGFTCLFNICPSEVSGAGCVMASATTGNYTTYGAALGARYASAANILWTFGDDYYGGNDTNLSACLTALRGAGDSHLVSIENFMDADSRYYAYNGSSNAWGLANAQWNWCYSYTCQYVDVMYAYTEPSPGPPVILNDGLWDDYGADNQRRNIWWALSSGSRGYCYGSDATAYTPSGFIAAVGSPADSSASVGAYWAAFASFTGWHKLVPDISNTLVTAGRGTKLGPIASGGDVLPSTNTYVSASMTADGTLAVIYNPAADTQTITVAGSVMSGGAIGTAKWVDPVNGAVTAATIASTFTRSGTNSAGAHDWVLVLTVP